MTHTPLLPLFTIATAGVVGAIVLLLPTGHWWAVALAFIALLAAFGVVAHVLMGYLRDES